MKHLTSFCLFTMLSFLPVQEALAQGQEMLSNLQIVGTVRPTGKAPPFKVGDTVKVVEEKGGSVSATGAILDDKGTFYVEMNKQAGYNGTALRLGIVTGGEEFPLKDGKEEAHMIFKGGFPFPKRENLSLYYGDGSPVAETKAEKKAASSACPSTLPKCDADGDGAFTSRDIDFIKQQMSSKTPSMAADVNGDGKVNSADLVAAIKEAGRAKGTE